MWITGHGTRTMFDRYNTVDSFDMKNAVARLERFLFVGKSVESDAKQALTKNV